MAEFLLDCDAINSANSTISSLVGKIETIYNSVYNYDTENDDGFDFNKAQSIIAANIKAAGKKVSNTANLMTSVVEAHTALQKSLGKGEIPNAKTEKTSSNQETNSTPGVYSSRGNSTGGGHSSNHSSLGAAVISSGVGVLAKDIKEKVYDKEIKENKLNKIIKVNDYTASFTTIERQALEQNSKVIVDNQGFYTTGGRYIITADKSVGKVGDQINITNANGNIVQCIIGKTVNTNSNNLNDKISLNIDNSKFTNGVNVNLVVTKIDNISNTQNLVDMEGTKTLNENSTIASTTVDNKNNTMEVEKNV